jgi:hypothetical protein
MLFISNSSLHKMKNKQDCTTMPTPQTVLSLTGGVNTLAALSSTCISELNSDFPTRDAIMTADGNKSCTGNGSFGPWASIYPAVPVPSGCDTTNWAQQRVLKIIDYFVTTKGFNYCHHHVGTWMPGTQYQQLLNICPTGGSGDPTAVEGYCSNAQPTNWKGIDCTTYTATVYNYGFGMYVVTNTGNQACGPNAPGVALNLTRDQQSQFLPGDIIYLKKDSAGSAISHGIFWTGIQAVIDTPTNPSSSPFGLQNLLKNVPPCQQAAATGYLSKYPNGPIYVISDSHWNGPNYRPFGGWYYDMFSHVRRIINPNLSLKGTIAATACVGLN